MDSLLHRWSLRFIDAAQEARYEAQRLPAAARRHVLIAWVALVTNLAFILGDIVATRDQAAFETMLVIRLAISTPAMLVMIWIYPRPFGLRHQNGLAIFALSLLCVLTYFQAGLLEVDVMRQSASSVNLLFTIAGLAIIDLPFLWRIAVAAGLFAWGTLRLFDVGLAPHVIATDSIIFFTIINLALAGAWFSERHRRRAFAANEQADRERARSDTLLLNILPAPIAARLKDHGEPIADGFANVTVLFSDIVGFTKMSERLAPEEVVRRLNRVFSAFDELADKHGLEKIKTIGDAYMVAGGLPTETTDHACAVTQMGLDMQRVVAEAAAEFGEDLQVRIGINTGPVVAGVIGRRKFIYDLWGDTVNTASRMESHGEAGRVHITEATRNALGDRFDCQPRGEIEVKSKGTMRTWWVA